MATQDKAVSDFLKNNPSISSIVGDDPTMMDVLDAMARIQKADERRKAAEREPQVMMGAQVPVRLRDTISAITKKTALTKKAVLMDALYEWVDAWIEENPDVLDEKELAELTDIDTGDGDADEK